MREKNLGRLGCAAFSLMSGEDAKNEHVDVAPLEEYTPWTEQKLADEFGDAGQWFLVRPFAISAWVYDGTTDIHVWTAQQDENCMGIYANGCEKWEKFPAHGGAGEPHSTCRIKDFVITYHRWPSPHQE